MNTITVEQVVEVPPTRRLFIEVPQEIPVGQMILTFTPVPANSDAEYLRRKAMEPQDRKLFELYADELNAEAKDVLSYQSLDL